LKKSPLIRVAGYLSERLRFVLAGTLNAFDGVVIGIDSLKVRS
jgi:hypothetical protein